MATQNEGPLTSRYRGIKCDAEGVLDMLTVVNPKVKIQGAAWVKQKIKQRCKAENICYSQNKWKMFGQYFARIWISKFHPGYWNVYGMQRAIVNRTNNPLGRYHRELNTRFKVPRPALYKTLRNPTSFSRKASFQKMLTHPRVPRAAKLPDISDVRDSDTEEDGDDSAEMASTAAVVENEEYNHDEELNVSDDRCEALWSSGYDTSFDYETEEKS
ncbi:Hypothetical protein PHPALM_12397 [Phytophthora palmivora]|uniref:Uncharacterized protein n=1 Tax=Phytophthora palmivora TaxID=4796 RepID=A0A2P4XZV7_9STRA|nr:Hypothetical protein PHPALM_12397 [Phytophthora palmivora]